MRIGFVLSMMMHAALLALALMSWPRTPVEPPKEANLVDVEMVTISTETNIAPATPTPDPPPETPPVPAPQIEPSPAPPPPELTEANEAPPLPAPERPEPPPKKVAALPPEPRAPAPPKPVLTPEPEPTPKKDREKPKPEAKKPEPVVEPKVTELKPDKPSAKVKPTEKPKAKKEPEFDLDKIAGAADKLAKDQPKPQQQAALPPAPSTASRTSAGRATAMSASEIDALRSTITKCWNMPAGAPNPETLVVRLKLFLNADGTVARQPELVDTAGRTSDPYFRAAAESAIRAVQVCAPYQLPADKYDDWAEITINFRPPF